jgi:hypothetical protein
VGQLAPRETQDQPAQLDPQEKQAPQVHLVSQAQLDPQEKQAPLVSQAQLDPQEKQAPPVHLVSQAPVGLQVGQLAPLEKPAQQALLDQQVKQAL